MNPRLRVLKTSLWTIMGILAVLTAVRFLHGLGSTTALSDAAPWGFWIAFDVMAGVALAAGGFVVAATVYIFGLERYRAFARPAILTALLGYMAVAIGLLYDLGLPWHIWHPMIFPQPHSVLFEVAMCVMLYLTVLFLEFSPVILEHPLFDKPFFHGVHRLVKKAAIPLVIAGIVLSTLHQSSLGSLFLIAPYRLHPLWYSPIIWVLFFISAVGLGLMMVTLESFFSAWAFGHKLRIDLIQGLGKAASVVLLIYAGVRLIDLGVRGRLGLIFDGSSYAFIFLAELLMGAVVPAVLLSIRRVRANPTGLFLASVLTVAGMIGYRFNVCIVAFERPAGMSYFPSWMEVFISAGVVAGALLTFIFLVEHLRVYPEEHTGVLPAPRAPRGAFDPGRLTPMLPQSLVSPRRYTLALVIGASVCLALLPRDALFGAQPSATPVERSLQLGENLVIDGNRNGRQVLFPHDKHAAALGEKSSCKLCHHENLPFQQQSACYECHRDMYIVSDIFDHHEHVAKLGGNDACIRCHRDTTLAKTRASATPCGECHEGMVVAGARVAPPSGGPTGYAPGYMQAMHGLCVSCHEEKRAEDPQKFQREFAECRHCHKGDVLDLHELGPYAAKGNQAP